ncbi:uncharacterized protein LOC126807978 [Patella vulgata]|uniref:uncharacterized protein LOC126807978 n=1 Tax=Patella vulgata TaxID=6465 RepID=UPI0024A921B2|nr:uncharacterized protein LOC126807978 [Patella vulgata]XP_055959121.1 uncharacterized protein LOC126807978 [Patella vulgata]
MHVFCFRVEVLEQVKMAQEGRPTQEINVGLIEPTLVINEVDRSRISSDTGRRILPGHKHTRSIHTHEVEPTNKKAKLLPNESSCRSRTGSDQNASPSFNLSTEKRCTDDEDNNPSNSNQDNYCNDYQNKYSAITASGTGTSDVEVEERCLPGTMISDEESYRSSSDRGKKYFHQKVEVEERCLPGTMISDEESYRSSSDRGKKYFHQKVAVEERCLPGTMISDEESYRSSSDRGKKYFHQKVREREAKKILNAQLRAKNNDVKDETTCNTSTNIPQIDDLLEETKYNIPDIDFLLKSNNE